MKVLIIEDEAPAARRLKALLKECDESIQVLDVIESIEGAVKWLNTHTAPEIIFSDIQLADGLSFDIFNRVKVTAPVIFTTAFDQYSIRAFKVNSIDYLLKPIEKSDLQTAIEKYKNLRQQFGHTNTEHDLNVLLQSLKSGSSYKNRFLVKLGERLISISSDQIAYFHSEEKLTFLVTTANKKYPLDYSLDDLETILDPALFFRLNRQFICKIDCIKTVHHYFNGKLKLFLEPDCQKELIVSRDRAPELKDWLDGRMP